MKKKQKTLSIISAILIMLFLLIAFIPLYSVFGESIESVNLTTENLSFNESFYYDFNGIKQVEYDNGIIATVNNITGQENEKNVFNTISTFDKNGKFLKSLSGTDNSGSELRNIQKIQIFKNNIYVLTSTNATTYKILKLSLDLSTKTEILTKTMSGSDIDIAAFSILSIGSNDYLYTLTGGPNSRTVSYYLLEDTIASSPLNTFPVDPKAEILETISTNGNFYCVVNSQADSDGAAQGNQQVKIYDLHNTIGALHSTISLKKPGTINDISLSNDNIFVILHGGEIAANSGIYLSNFTDNTEFASISAFSPDSLSNDKPTGPASLCTYSTDGITSILIADAKIINGYSQIYSCVKKFTLAVNSINYNNLFIGTFSQSVGNFFNPADIFHTNSYTYVADSDNYRIQKIDNNNNKLVTAFPLSYENTNLKPKKIAVKNDGTMFFSTSSNSLYKVSANGTVTKLYDNTFGNICDLAIRENDNTLFVVTDTTVFIHDEALDTFSTYIDSIATSGIAFNIKTSDFILVNGNKCIIYDNNLNCISEIVIPSENTIKNAVFDFEGNVFILAEDSSGSNKLFNYNNDGVLKKTGILSISFDEIAYDTVNSRIMSIKFDEHKIQSTIYSSIDFTSYNDLTIPTDILDKRNDSNVKIGTLLESSNYLIYPLNKNKQNYPTSYAVKEITKTNSEKVIVCATYNGYFLVLDNGKVGFMDAATIDVSNQDTDTPFTYAYTLHKNTPIFKYPSLTQDVNQPQSSIFEISKLAKNIELTILDMVSDYKSGEDFYWYRVSYYIDNNLVTGYIPRYSVSKNLEKENPVYRYARINAPLFVSTIKVYSDVNGTDSGKTLNDREKIQILDDSDSKYYKIIQVNYDSENAISGYILKSDVSFETMSRSQIAGFIILGAVILGAIATYVIVKIVKRRRIA